MNSIAETAGQRRGTVLARCVRALVASMAVAGMQSCATPTASSSSSASSANAGAVVVTIGPGLHYSGGAYNNSGYAQCWELSPNPVVVKVNQVIEWRNNTNSTVTIAGGSATPWVSVNAGAISAGLSFSQAGSVPYGLYLCHPLQLNAGGSVDAYATIAVTIN